MRQSKADIIREYCRKWPKHGNLTIAKAVYKKYPLLWSQLESARSSVRSVRGANGEHARRHQKDKTLRQPQRKAGQPEIELPESCAVPWEPVEVSTVRNLVISDVHLPYHDAEAVNLALNAGKSFGADGLILNGDICDFFSVSRWDRDPREVNLKREIDLTKQFLSHVRQHFPKAKIVWKLGNHEERWEHFLWKKAPELLDVPEFDFASIFSLQALDISVVRNKRIIMLGKLPVLHGHEYPKGLTNPVNQARGMFLRGLECAIAGHGHRSSEHSETTMMGRLITCWSTGCLCHLNPDFFVLNKWSHGFALVEIDKHGGFTVQNKRIYKSQIW